MEVNIVVLTLMFAITAYARVPAETSTILENEPQTTDRSDDSQTTDTSLDGNPQANRDSDASVPIVIEDLQTSFANEDAPELGAADGDFFYDDVIARDPDEAMETAAGFAPLPFLKKRRRTQRPYATRRFYRKPHANRRFQYFYPYFYGFYPSSLRYFKYY